MQRDNLLPIGLGDSMRAFSRGIPLFFNWWSEELKACIPGPLRDLLVTSPIQIEIDGDAISVVLPIGRSGPTRLSGSLHHLDVLRRQLDEIPAGKSSDKQAIVLVPEPSFLRREVILPSAARPHLMQAVKYQLSRISPFRETEAQYTARAIDVRPETNELLAEVFVVAKRELARLNEIVAALGLSVERFTFANARSFDGKNPPSLAVENAVQDSGGRIVDYGLLIGATLAIAATFGALYHQRTSLNDRLASEIKTLQSGANQVVALKDALEKQDAVAANIAAITLKTPHQTAVLNKLADNLPDDVRLQEYRTTNATAYISGYAADASRLLAIVDAIDGFRSAKFAAPVARDQQLGLDRFTLTFDLENRP